MRGLLKALLLVPSLASPIANPTKDGAITIPVDEPIAGNYDCLRL
jgi:hypothetical protein